MAAARAACSGRTEVLMTCAPTDLRASSASSAALSTVFSSARAAGDGFRRRQ